MHRLLIVEDEPGIREPLADFFRGRGYLVEAAGSAEEAVAHWRGGGCSLAILDLLLPGLDGLEFLGRMRREGDRTPVIILTARGAEAHRVKGLRLGADDYVVKPFSAEELCARVEAVLRRAGVPPAPVRIGEARVDLAGHRVERAGRSWSLPRKEAELLAFLARHPGVTFGREQLLREVWGYAALPTTRTVDTQVYNLRRKLEADPDRPRCLITVHGVGYRLDGVADPGGRME